MLKQFAENIEDLRRLIDDSRSASFLLAVSGGMDSMCMADLFLRTVGTESFSIAHCNFSLRGEESDGDEALVREWAERNGVSLFARRFQTKEYAQSRGVSIEMAARELRYGWFSELCTEHGFDVVAVAHNANDNAETLMLNLLRGTGLNGLHGMSALTVSQADLKVFRPLLEYTRKQIDGYVLDNRVPYRHDSSNFESDYKRNKIRNDVFPVFEKINPSFVRTLNREIGYFAEAGLIVEDWCRMQVPAIMSDDQTINIDKLLATQHWRYLLYYILSPYGFNQQALSSIESLLTSGRTVSGKRFESPTHVLVTGRGVLRVVKLEDCDLLPVSEEVLVVRSEGVFHVGKHDFKVEVLPWTSDMSLRQPDGMLIMDAGKLKFPFVCRRWRQGDWFIPFGMKGKKKVSDLFADLKYDSFAKETAVIIVDTQTECLAEQQHVAGLLGVRMDDRYKVTADTDKIIRITCF